jgi:hypothetical protein
MEVDLMDAPPMQVTGKTKHFISSLEQHLFAKSK